VEAAAELPAKSAIIDGEIVAFEPDGRTSIEAFRKAMSSAPGRLVYVAFDLLHLDGKDLRQLPCRGRRDLLAALLVGRAEGAIQFSDHIVGNGVGFYESACQLGLEGIVSKRADAPYRGGRSDAWVKTKCYQESQLVVAGIQRERSKPSYAVMASPEDGRYVGSAFIALPRGQRDRLYELAEAGGGKMPAGYEPKKSFQAEWIKPKLLGRVLHLRGEDTLRHARLVEAWDQ
jgi:ATP-dependent DNA ligase